MIRGTRSHDRATLAEVEAMIDSLMDITNPFADADQITIRLVVNNAIELLQGYRSRLQTDLVINDYKIVRKKA